MERWGMLLAVLSVFLLMACDGNQLTGSVVNTGACSELGKGLYDNDRCNLNCKIADDCQAVQVEGRVCYRCKDLTS